MEDEQGLRLLLASAGQPGIALAQQLETQLGSWFYIYWITPGSPSHGTPRPSERTVLAFASADAAMAFAQVNHLSLTAEGVRLRRVSLPRLLLALINQPSIQALLIIPDEAPTAGIGRFPEGHRLDRHLLLIQLGIHQPNDV